MNNAGKDVCRTSGYLALGFHVLIVLIAPTSGGAPPNTTPINKKRAHKCARGYKRCPLYTGLGGFDCVDTTSDPENCGGCVAIDDGVQAPIGEPGTGGVDCTAIADVSMVQCVKSHCVIRESSLQPEFPIMLLTVLYHLSRIMSERLHEGTGRQDLYQGRRDCTTSTTSPSVPCALSWQIRSIGLKGPSSIFILHF